MSIFRIRTLGNFAITWWRHQMETFSALLASVRGIDRSPVSSPHKSRWRGTLMFFFICTWTNRWANIRDAGDMRRHCAHYDVIVMMNDSRLNYNCTRDYFWSTTSSILKKPYKTPLMIKYLRLLEYRLRIPFQRNLFVRLRHSQSIFFDSIDLIHLFATNKITTEHIQTYLQKLWSVVFWNLAVHLLHLCKIVWYKYNTHNYSWCKPTQITEKKA